MGSTNPRVFFHKVSVAHINGHVGRVYRELADLQPIGVESIGWPSWACSRPAIKNCRLFRVANPGALDYSQHCVCSAVHPNAKLALEFWRTIGHGRLAFYVLASPTQARQSNLIKSRIPSLITAASLKSYSLKDLAQLAKKRGVVGWHSMRKDQLIRALEKSAAPSRKASGKKPAAAKGKPSPKAKAKAPAAKVARSGAKSSAASRKKGANGSSRTVPVAKPKSPQVLRKIQKAQEQRDRQRDLAGPAVLTGRGNGTASKDRVVLLVRDPYWLQATWEVTRQAVQRAQAAMAEQWHTSRPTLRLLEVENTGTTSSAERVAREIVVHGGVNNWYIDVSNPPHSFRVELGYLGTNGRFFAIARSNTVTTPRPGSADSLDENWSDVEENYAKIFAQSGGYAEQSGSQELQEVFEERLQRPIGPPLMSRFGVGAERMLRRKRDFPFEVDADMVVFGRSQADAHVTLSGEPVKLRPDGSFAVRMSLPDKRQVIPIVAASRDGVEQRTIVIAVERNTKVMEPMSRDTSE